MSYVPENQGLGKINHVWHYAKSHDRHFGAAAPTFPASLNRPRLPALDQGDTEFCTAFGEATSNAYEFNKTFSGEWQTQAEGKFLGYPIINGADPYPSMQATAIYGSLHSILSPFTLAAKEADFIADCANWDPTLETIAKTYRTQLIPYYVDGPYDIFDNIRTALYQAFLANETGVVKAFGFWYASWNKQAHDSSKRGYLKCPLLQECPISRHRYTIIDWITVADKPYLVAAMTQGNSFGDNGFVYFDRDTINHVFANASSNGLGLYINRPARDGWVKAIQWLTGIFYYLKSRATIYAH